MKNKNILIALILISALMANVAYSTTDALSSNCPPDNTAPFIEITHPNCGQIFTTATINVNGTAYDDTEISNVTIKVDSEPWQLADGTTTWSTTVTLIPGQNIITAKATDTSGNINEKSIIAIYGLKDNTPPQILEMWPPINAIITKNNLELGLVTNENATCKYDTYDTDYDSMNNTFLKTGGTEHRQPLTLTDGTYTYYVRCMDDTGQCTGAAGNKNQESKNTTFTVNTTSSIRIIANDVNVNQTQTFELPITLQNAGVSNISGILTIAIPSGLALSSGSTNQPFALDTGASQTYTPNITAVLWGDYIINLTATHDNLTATHEVHVHSNPNYAVYDHDVSITGMSAPAMATTGNTVSISAMLTNKGRSDETEIPVIFSVDGVPIQTNYYNLTSQMNTIISFNWAASLGTHELSLFANLTTDGNISDNSAGANISVSAVPVPPPSGGGGGGGSNSGGGGGIPTPPAKNNNNASFSNISIPDSINYGETLYVSGCVSKLGKNSTVELYLDGALKSGKKAVVPSICFNLSAGVPGVGKHTVYLWLNSSNIDITKYVTVNESRNETPGTLTEIELSDIVINGSVREGIPATIQIPMKTSKLADVSISLFSDGALIGGANASIDGTYTASFDHTFNDSGKKTLRAFAITKDGSQDMILKEITVEKNIPTGNLFSSIIRNPYVIAAIILLVLLVIYYYARKKPETPEPEEPKTDA